MHEHKNGQDKTYDNMHEVSKMQTACPEYFIHENDIGKYQGPAGDEDQWHQEIKHCKVRDLLERVEFTPAVYGERGFFTAENAKHIIIELNRNFFNQPASSHAVVKAIFREHISEKHHNVVCCEENASNIMHRYRDIETDHVIFRV